MTNDDFDGEGGVTEVRKAGRQHGERVDSLYFHCPFESENVD